MPVCFFKTLPPSYWTSLFVCLRASSYINGRDISHCELVETHLTFTLNVQFSDVGPATSYTKEFLVFISCPWLIPEYLCPIYHLQVIS